MHRTVLVVGVAVVGVCWSAGALTGSGDSAVGAIETVAPVFSGLAVEPAQAAAGDTVTITFSVSESLGEEPLVTVGGNEADFVSEEKAGDYTYAYGVQEADVFGMATVEVTGSDALGNPGSLSSTLVLEIVEASPVPLYGWLVFVVLLAAGVLAVARRGWARGLLLVLVLLAAPMAAAEAPSVTNVAFVQQPDGAGGTEAAISYDLVAPNGPCAITVSLSKNGGADGFIHPVTAVAGDIAGVSTGTGKQVVWDVRADYPEENIPNARIRVTADDGLVQHTITCNVVGSGTCVADPATVNHGSTSDITVTPAVGWHLVGVVDSVEGAKAGSYTTTAVTANRTVTATFEADPLPEVTSFAIDAGAASATDAEVTLDNTATESPTEYMASEASDFGGASWQPYAAAASFTLSSGEGGTKTVYFKVRNAAGESDAVSDTISLTEDTILLSGDVPLTVVWCPSGSFQMGRYAGELDSHTREDPQHLVTFGSGFWMGKYEVTQAQWVAVMGSNPSYFTGDLQRPVEQVSWDTITGSFLPALNAYTGKTFRLPSEAEWEYACRAGTATRFYWGDDLSYTQIGTYAWYSGNSGSTTHAVGTAGGTGNPNAWGLYDMSGNVSEWVQDWYHSTYTGAPADGSAWVVPTAWDRMRRGGSWSYDGPYCRSACRDYGHPSFASYYFGFRLAR